MAIPIFFVHCGSPEYLWATTRQARLSNPESDVILLGDASNKHLAWPTHHGMYQDYMSMADQFASIYEHLSSNSYAYELLCYQRWFMICEYLQKHNLDACCYVDSDLMLYTDVTMQLGLFAGDELSLCKISGHTLLIHSLQSLQRFCTYMNQMYTDAEMLADLRARYRSFQDEGRPGGICDMTALDDYRRTGRCQISDLSEIKDGSTFDVNINESSGGYAMHNGQKKIQWIDGAPFCQHLPSQQLVRFNTLHFQGHGKQHVLSHASQFDLSCARMIVKQTAARGFRRVCKSVSKRMAKRAA